MKKYKIYCPMTRVVQTERYYDVVLELNEEQFEKWQKLNQKQKQMELQRGVFLFDPDDDEIIGAKEYYNLKRITISEEEE